MIKSVLFFNLLTTWTNLSSDKYSGNLSNAL